MKPIFVAMVGKVLLLFLLLSGCDMPCYNPTGCRQPSSASYTTTSPMMVKGIQLPVGTEIIYDDKPLFSSIVLSRPWQESHIEHLVFPEGSDIRWAGVRITSISRNFNPELPGIGLAADPVSLKQETTAFARLWASCRDDLDVLLHDMEDWSFHVDNIVDVQSCSVLYQRGDFHQKDDEQRFLDKILKAMRNLD